MNISEILLQYFSRFALSPVVWVFFQKSQLHLGVTPVDVCCRMHLLFRAQWFVWKIGLVMWFEVQEFTKIRYGRGPCSGLNNLGFRGLSKCSRQSLSGVLFWGF